MATITPRCPPRRRRARSFPPENCGGIGGYWQCVEVVKTGKDPEDMAEWIGNGHPDHFDLAKTKKRFDR